MTRRILAGVLLCCSGVAQAGSNGTTVVRVSYVTAQSVYLDGGRNRSLAPGDSGIVLHQRTAAGTLVITAVSQSSSAARVITATDSIRIGDTVSFSVIASGIAVTPARGDTPPVPASATSRETPLRSTTHGRVALQYVGIGGPDGSAVESRPAIVLRLDASPLAGTGFRFAFYGRVDQMSGASAGAGEARGTTLHLYDLTLSRDDPQALYGFSVGRISSAYAGGLGLFDGAQLLLRLGNATMGILGGFQPDLRTSAFASGTQRLAGFVNYLWVDNASLRGTSTLAYGQQLYHGALDRDYLYLQNSVALGALLFIYHNAELDLHKREGESRAPALRLTNSFLTVSYQPLSWLTANLGYDASRQIEFLQSVKSLADSLLDRDLRQGFRGSLYVRLTGMIALSLLGGYRLPVGDAPNGYSAGIGVRYSEIAGTRFSVGGEYLKIRSPYTDGANITGDIEYTAPADLTLSFRWNRYAFSALGAVDQGGRSAILTMTGSASWNSAHGWYVTLFADRVTENDRLVYRVFAETGFHF